MFVILSTNHGEIISDRRGEKFHRNEKQFNGSAGPGRGTEDLPSRIVDESFKLHYFFVHIAITTTDNVRAASVKRVLI